MVVINLFLTKMQLKPVYKIWILIGVAFVTLSMPFLVYVLRIESCEPPFEKCDHFIVHLEDNRKVVFCLNETTSILQSMHFYDCDNVFRFSILDTFEIFKALKNYFNDTKTAASNAKSFNSKYCPIMAHEYLVKFCFDSNRLLSNVILFDKVTLNPQEAYHLHLYLKVFLKYV